MAEQRLLHHRFQGQGPSLIMLHGLFGSMDNLTPVARRLAERRRILSVDLRNHGRSFHGDKMDYGTMAVDVIRLMDHLSIDQSVVLGHSMGGKTAMQMALDYPERVTALIVGDIAPVTYPPLHTSVIQAISHYQPERGLSRGAVDQQLASDIHMPEVRQLLIKGMMRDQQGRFVWRMNVDAMVANYDQIRSQPEGKGKVFHRPVLFIKGGDSDYLLPKHREVIAPLFPNASVKVVPGVGHWLHAEKPELFHGIVERFLAALVN